MSTPLWSASKESCRLEVSTRDLPFGDMCWLADQWNDAGYNSLIWDLGEWVKLEQFTESRWICEQYRWLCFQKRSLREGLQKLLKNGGLHYGERKY